MGMKTLITGSLIAIAATSSVVRPSVAQVKLFELPNTAVDLSTYSTIEECKAAMIRVLDLHEYHAKQTTRVFPDTMPFDRERLQRPLPQVAVETARECLGAITAHIDTAGLAAWDLLLPLYLDAGQEGDARELFERRIEELDQDSTAELSRVLTRAVTLLLESHPPRYDLAEEIVFEYVDKLPKLKDRVELYGHLLGLAYGQANGDLNEDNEAAARARRILAQVNVMIDSASSDQLQQMAKETVSDVTSTTDELMEQFNALAMLFVGQSYRRDSLRVSTEAYVRSVKNTHDKALGLPPAAILGQRAPELEGDVWLGCEKDPCESYPRPGRVTLVWFFGGCFDYMVRTHFLSEYICAQRLPVRRIHDRFPEIDIVVVMKSTGRFAYVKEDLTPEREAQFVRQWLDDLGLTRAVLTMTETQGWRYPEPDGRWAVRHSTANEKNYWPRDPRLPVVLVDQDGIAVHAGTLSFNNEIQKLINEQEFVRLIEILLEREKAKSQ